MRSFGYPVLIADRSLTKEFLGRANIEEITLPLPEPANLPYAKITNVSKLKFSGI